MAKSKRSKARIEASLATSNSPIFALDERRRLIFFNSGCEQLTGWPAAEVIGTTCNYAGHSDHSRKDSIGGSLAPPPEVFAGKAQVLPATILCRDGETVSRLIHFFPVANASGKFERVVGLMTPIEKTAKPAASTAAQQLHAELAALHISLRQRFGVDSLICRSEAMLRVAEQIRVARASNVSVHLRGEHGTGKEHVARAIHAGGPAAAQAFVPLDCRQLPSFDLKQTLRRLFPVSGGPAGDDSATSGLQPGSLFLTNVDMLPRDLQEFLVESFRSSTPWKEGKRRLISSSCGDIGAAVGDEAIRPDFFYLLTTMEIELPPLRRRAQDLPALAQSILEDLNRHAERQVGGFADEVWSQFREYNWPANVDELIAVVTEAHRAAKGALITVGDLPFRFRAGRDGQAVGPPRQLSIEPLEQLLERVEIDQIRRALEAARNNRSKAAELLGITRPRLYRRIETLGLDAAWSDDETAELE